MLRTQIKKMRIALQSDDPETFNEALVWTTELLTDQLGQQLRNLTTSDMQTLKEGRLVRKDVTTHWFHFALELGYDTKAPIIYNVCEAVGEIVRCDIKAHYNLSEKRRAHYIEIIADPDKDFLNFNEEEVEEVAIEAVAEKPLSMSAVAGGR